MTMSHVWFSHFFPPGPHCKPPFGSVQLSLLPALPALQDQSIMSEDRVEGEVPTGTLQGLLQCVGEECSAEDNLNSLSKLSVLASQEEEANLIALGALFGMVCVCVCVCVQPKWKITRVHDCTNTTHSVAGAPSQSPWVCVMWFVCSQTRGFQEPPPSVEEVCGARRGGDVGENFLPCREPLQGSCRGQRKYWLVPSYD